MRKKKLFVVVISIATVALGVVCYFLLPERIAVQWSFSGEVSSTLPSFAAILISWGLTALLLALSYSKKNSAYLALGLIGLVMQAVFLIMN